MTDFGIERGKVINFLVRQVTDIRDGGWFAFKRKFPLIPTLLAIQFNKASFALVAPFRMWFLEKLGQRSGGRFHDYLAVMVARTIYAMDVWPACERHADWDDSEVQRVTNIIRKVECLLQPIHDGFRTRIAALELLECGARILSDAEAWQKYACDRFEALEQWREQSYGPVTGRYIDASSLHNFGFFCHWVGLMKARQLGLVPDETIFVNVDEMTPMANRHLFDEYISPHVKRGALSKARPTGEYLPDPMRLGDDVYPNNHGALAVIEDKWEREGRHPFFALSPADRAFGLSVLYDLGMPDGAWFVSLHVRSSSYKGSEGFRDAVIEDYLDAINLIVVCGGWVVRVGDPGAPPLPPMNCVIDFAHSQKRSKRMDIFLLAACDLFVGGSSGPPSVAAGFGVPCALLDYLPPAGLCQSRGAIYLPRLLRCEHSGRALSFSELYSPKYSLAALDATFRILGVKPIANTRDEITDLVRQLLAESGFLPEYFLDPAMSDAETLDRTMAAARRMERFNEICRDANPLLLPDGVPAMAPLARIGDAFLEKYQHLIS